jgi:hypothetical protein
MAQVVIRVALAAQGLVVKNVNTAEVRILVAEVFAAYLCAWVCRDPGGG